jgi:hypothetical protein
MHEVTVANGTVGSGGATMAQPLGSSRGHCYPAPSARPPNARKITRNAMTTERRTMVQPLHHRADGLRPTWQSSRPCTVRFDRSTS